MGENGPGRGSPRERGAQAEKWGERKGGRQVAVTGPGLCTGASLLEMPPVPFDPLSPYCGLQVHFLGDGHWFCQKNTSPLPVLTVRGPWLILACIMSRGSVFLSVNTGGGARVRLALCPERGPGTGDWGRGWVCVTWEVTVLSDALPCDHVFSVVRGNSQCFPNRRVHEQARGRLSRGEGHSFRRPAPPQFWTMVSLLPLPRRFLLSTGHRIGASPFTSV